MTKVDGMLPKTEKRYLRYDFTDAEVHDMSKELATKNQEAANVKNEKKAAVSQFGSRITSIEADISNLSDKVANGFEFRDVTCDVYFHQPEQGMKRLIRKDTNQVIEEKMTSSDWNLWTQFDEKSKAAEEEAPVSEDMEVAPEGPEEGDPSDTEEDEKPF